MTLPGFEEDIESPAPPSESFGLSGRAAVVTGHPAVVDLLRSSGKWIALAGLVVAALIAIVSLWPESTPRVQVDMTLAPGAHDDLTEAVASDSLRFVIGDLTAKWNEVQTPPRIAGGLIRSPEAGQFDSFSYRFNTSSLIAGAYDDGNDFVYALMVSTWLSDENATRMSIHLCHVVAPYSQECIDAYTHEGLARMPIEHYRDAEHRAEWKVGDIRWRLNIVDNIQTIRVLAPGAG